MVQTILYNGSLGSTLDLQGWLAYGITPLSSATQTVASGSTNLNSPIAGKGDYSNFR